NTSNRFHRLITYPLAESLIWSNVADKRLHPIVPASTAALPDTYHAPGQRNLVVNDDHFRLVALKPAEQFAHRQTTQVHVRLWLGQQDFLPRQLAPTNASLPFGPLDAHAAEFRQPVHDQETQVVRRPSVFRTRIAEADDQPHPLGHPLAHIHWTASVLPPEHALVR